jgi:hypothetical protein
MDKNSNNEWVEMGWCPVHEYSPIVAMGAESVTLACGYVVM